MDKNYKNLIDLPEELDSIIIKGVKKGEEHNKAKNKFNKKKTNKILISAAIVIVVIGTTVITSPEVVRAIPGVGNIYDMFIGKSKYKKYSKSMNMSLESKGVYVTLDQLVMTDKKIVATLITTGDIDENTEIVFRGNVEGYGGRSGCKTKMVDDKTAVSIVEIEPNNMPEDKLNMQISLSDFAKNGEEILGRWVFYLDVDVEDIKMTEEVKIYKGEKKNINGFEHEVEELKISSIENTISMITNDESQQVPSYYFKNDKGEYILTDFGGIVPNEESGLIKTQYEIFSDLRDFKYIDIYPMKRSYDEIYKRKDGKSILKAVNASEEDEMLLLKPQDSPDEGLSYYYINKEKSFMNIKDFNGKKVDIDNINSIEVKDVVEKEKYVDIIFNYNGCGSSYSWSLIDENLNLVNNLRIDEEWVDYDKRESKVRIYNLDTSKKYTIAAIQENNKELKEENKIRIELDK